MIDEANSYNLLSNLLKQEGHCCSKAKLKLIEIEDCLKDCRINVQKSTKVIKESIHSTINQLEKLELNLCLELVEENQKQETILMKTKEDLSFALSNFSKYTSDAKIKLVELDAVDKENLSLSMVKKILPNIREILKDFHVDPIKFIPMPLAVDNDTSRSISIGYIQKHGIDVNNFLLRPIKKFVLSSVATVSIIFEAVDSFEFSKYEDYISWDVECQGAPVTVKTISQTNEFNIKFTVEQEAQYRISFKILNQHVPGSPLYIFPTAVPEESYVNGCSQKRKSSTPTTISDSFNGLSEGNNVAEDLSTLVDDLPLFAQELGESCSVALVQFFSKNVIPQQSNSGPQTKKMSYEALPKAKLVDRSRTIMSNMQQPLRMPKAASTLSETMTSIASDSITDRPVKEERVPVTSAAVIQKTPLRGNGDRKETPLKSNGYLKERIEMSPCPKTNQKESLSGSSTNQKADKLNEIFKCEQLTETKTLRSQWNDTFSESSEAAQGQKQNTQFNELLEKRLAAKVAFCVRSTNDFGFKCPIGVAELKSLQILVADTFNHRLLLFSAEGEFIELLKTPGLRMNHPSAIAVLPTGRFAVRDDIAIHMFSSTGNHISTIGKDFLSKHFGLAVDQLGHLLTVEIVDDQLTIAVIDSESKTLLRRICIFDKDGEHRLKASMPRFITFRPPNDLLIVDLGNDVIFIVDMRTGKTKKKFGSPGKGEGQFNDPSGIVCDAEGYIIVGDSRNHRIQVFSPDGEFITVLRVNRPLRRPSGLFLSPNGGLFVLNYWEQSLVKYKLHVSRN